MSFWLVIVRVFILPFTWADVQPDPRLKTERRNRNQNTKVNYKAKKGINQNEAEQ